MVALGALHELLGLVPGLFRSEPRVRLLRSDYWGLHDSFPTKLFLFGCSSPLLPCEPAGHVLAIFLHYPPPPVQWSTGRHLADPCQYEAPLVAKWFVLSLLLKGAVKGLRGC